MLDWLLEQINTIQGYFLIAFLSSIALYVFFNQKDQLSRLAISNIATSVLLAGANLAAGVLFATSLRTWVQHSYDAWHIPQLDREVWQHVPVWVGVLFAIAAQDLVDYWNHRLMHTRLGWLTHAAHHSDTHVNAFTSFRVHILESLVMWTSYTLLLTWLQLPHLVPVMVVVMMLHNLYVHLNLNIDHGPFRYLLASPMFHRWHHADVPEAYGKNLANVIPLYDVIFGTYYMPGRCTATMGAQSAGIEGTAPVAIYLYPVVQGAKLIRAAARRLYSRLPHRKARQDEVLRA